MMKSYLIIAIFLPAILGCSKKRAYVEQEKSLPDDCNLSVEKEPHASPEKSKTREISKARLRRLDLNTPENLENSIATLRQLTRDLEIEEQLSHPEALNELYIALTKNQETGISMSIRGIFARAILNDVEEISSIMSELPGGEMRRFCVAYIGGKGLSSKQLGDIYRAMPESADRSDIADLLVAETFFKKGVGPALGFIQALTSPYEEKQALDSLASSMATAIQIGRQITPAEDLEKVKEYAKLIGQERSVRTLEKIRVPEQ